MRKYLPLFFLAFIILLDPDILVHSHHDSEVTKQFFDAAFYAENNPDVVAVYGNTEKRLLEHYLEHGRYEGRSANSNFNVLIYLALYNDLYLAFGNDLDAYAVHYHKYGINEERIAMCENPPPFQPIYKPGMEPPEPEPEIFNAETMEADGINVAAMETGETHALAKETGVIYTTAIEEGDIYTLELGEFEIDEFEFELVEEEELFFEVKITGVTLALMEVFFHSNTEEYLKERHEFDVFGNNTSIFRYYGNGILQSYMVLDYNRNLDLLNTYLFTDGGVVDYYQQKKFDQNGNIISKMELYDRDGDFLIVVEFGKGLMPLVHETYGYDENGNLVLIRQYLDNEILARYKIWEYNENGNPLKMEIYDARNNLIGFQSFVYDRGGNLVSSEIHRYVRNIAHVIEGAFEYNPDGKVSLYRAYDSDGNILSSEEYKYDEEGRLILTIAYDPDGDVLHWLTNTYTYYDEGIHVVGSEMKLISTSEMRYDGDEPSGYTLRFNDNTSYVFEYDYRIDDNRIFRSGYTKIRYDEQERPIGFYSYDDNLMLVMENRKGYDQLGFSKNHEFIMYDGDAVSFSANGSGYKYEYAFSENIAIRYTFDENGLLFLTETHEYDENGRVAVYRYSGGGNTDYRTEYRYDDKGKLIFEYTYFIRDGIEDLPSWVYYEYDMYGNVSAISIFDNSGILISSRVMVNRYWRRPIIITGVIQ